MMKVDEIYCSDCRELLEQLKDMSIDHVISDIPYGIGFDNWDVLYNNTNSALLGSSPAQKKAGKIFKTRGKPLNGWSESDRQISIEYYRWCRTWSDKLLRVTKPGSSIMIFAGRRLAHRVICAFEDSGFIFKDMIAWNKAKAPHRAQHISKVFERRNDFDSAIKFEGWKLGNLRPLFEPILWFMKPYKLGSTIADNVLKYGLGAFNEEIVFKYNQTASNYIFFESKKSDCGLHPAQKPLNLIKFLVELISAEKQIILDPFAGSGTTLLACDELNRHFIGFENEQKFVDVARRRLLDSHKNINLFDVGVIDDVKG